MARLVDGTFDAWSSTAAGVNHCAHPVRLTGSSQTIDAATGEVLGSFSSTDAPLGVLYRPCGNRRAEVCPPCSRTYARDTFAMIRAGIAGGKTIPDTVAHNPLLFVTFTAPSFGPVHGPRPHAGQPAGGRCRPRDRGRGLRPRSSGRLLCDPRPGRPGERCPAVLGLLRLRLRRDLAVVGTRAVAPHHHRPAPCPRHRTRRPGTVSGSGGVGAVRQGR